jgi:AraC family transcriptional regulator
MNGVPQSFARADPMDRARRHIEANLEAPLSLGELADAAGLSPYHFSRLFSGRYGFSPMAYVRVRRLEAAAEQLRSGPKTTLIDLALDCGFDSQEGFTRAFTRLFGVSPGRYRGGGRSTSTEILAMDAHTLSNLTQAPAPARKPALRISGLSGVFSEHDKAGIPLLWERLVKLLPAKGQAGWGTFGVCMAEPGPEPDPEPGAMRYLAGVAFAESAEPPEGLETVEIAPQAYLVFRQVLDGGPLQPQMLAAARAIWGERVPRSGYHLVHSPDLEVYPDDFEPNRPGGWVEWWIPVAG